MLLDCEGLEGMNCSNEENAKICISKIMQASIILSSLVNVHSNTRVSSSLLKIGEIIKTI